MPSAEQKTFLFVGKQREKGCRAQTERNTVLLCRKCLSPSAVIQSLEHDFIFPTGISVRSHRESGWFQHSNRPAPGGNIGQKLSLAAETLLAWRGEPVGSVSHPGTPRARRCAPCETLPASAGL